MRPVGRQESDAILGAMRQVALAGGHAISHADTASILAVPGDDVLAHLEMSSTRHVQVTMKQLVETVKAAMG